MTCHVMSCHVMYYTSLQCSAVHSFRDHIEFLLDGVTEEGALTQVLELSGNHLEEVRNTALHCKLSTLEQLQWELYTVHDSLDSGKYTT